jgi:hypothetical protein
MLKNRQSITARCVDWSTSRVFPLVAMVADPAAMVPPEGLPCAEGAKNKDARKETRMAATKIQAAKRAERSGCDIRVSALLRNCDARRLPVLSDRRHNVHLLLIIVYRLFILR